MNTLRKWMLTGLLQLAVLLFSFNNAFGQTTFTVSKADMDGTNGSFNWVIGQANPLLANGEDVVVYFNVPGDNGAQFVKITGEPAFSGSGNLTLAAATEATSPQGISGADANFRLLYFMCNAVVSNLTFEDFSNSTGAFWNRDTYNLTVDGCTFTNCAPAFSSTGNLELSNINKFVDCYFGIEVNGNTITINNGNQFENTHLTVKLTDASDNIKIENNTFTNSTLDIQKNLNAYTGTTDNLQILNNDFFDTGLYGLILYVINKNWTISGNFFSGTVNFFDTYDFEILGQNNTWGNQTYPLEFRISTGSQPSNNHLLIKNIHLYKPIKIIADAGVSPGLIVENCQITNTQNINYNPIDHNYSSEQPPVPFITNVGVHEEELVVKYRLESYSNFRPPFRVDFYTSNSEGDMLTHIGSTEFDNQTVFTNGDHVENIDLNGLATISIGDKIGATITSVGNESDWGYGTSAMGYQDVTEKGGIILPYNYFCPGTGSPINVEGVPSGGTLELTDLSNNQTTTQTNPFSFDPTAYAEGQYQVKYSYNGFESTKTITIGTPQVFNMTPSGGAVHDGGIMGLDGSEAGFDYQLIFNSTTVVETVAGTGSSISFPAQSLAGTYTVKAVQGGCEQDMNGQVELVIILANNGCKVIYNNLDRTTPGHLDYCIDRAVEGANLGNDYNVLFAVKVNGLEELVSINTNLPDINHSQGSITFNPDEGYSAQGIKNGGVERGLNVESERAVIIDGLDFFDFVTTPGSGSTCAIRTRLSNSLTIRNNHFEGNLIAIYFGSTSWNVLRHQNVSINNNDFVAKDNHSNAININAGVLVDNFLIRENRFTTSQNRRELAFSTYGSATGLRIENNILNNRSISIFDSNIASQPDYTISSNEFNSSTINLPNAGDLTIEDNDFVNKSVLSLSTQCFPSFVEQNTLGIPLINSGNLFGDPNISGESLTIRYDYANNQAVKNVNLVGLNIVGKIEVGNSTRGVKVRETQFIVNTETPIDLHPASGTGNNAIPSPIITNVEIDEANNQLVVTYELDATLASTYRTPFVVDFYQGDRNTNSVGESLIPVTAGSNQFDAGTVAGSHTITLSLGTVISGDKIAVTVTSIGDPNDANNYGHGTSEVSYYSTCGISGSVTEIEQYCEDNSGTVSLTAVPAGGTFYLDNNPIGNSFVPSSLAVGEHTLSYTLGACTSAHTFDITPLPQNTYEVTGGDNNCENTNTTIGLSGSETGIFYQLYHQPSAGAEKTAVGEVVAGTGGAISFGSSFTTPGIYTVATTGCVADMTEDAQIQALPLVYDMNGAGYYCAPASQSVGLSSSEAGYTYQLMFAPKANPGTPEIKESLSGTGTALSFTTPASEVGTYYVQAVNGSCSVRMNGEVQIISLEVLDIGQESVCTGSDLVITVPNSETGIEYSAGYFPGSPQFEAVASQQGNGSDISITIPASALIVNTEYQVRASHTEAGCTAMMNGSRIVNQTPVLAPISSSYCLPVSIEIGTETSGQYQYRLNHGAWQNMPNGTFVPVSTGHNYDDYDFRYISMYACTSNIVSTRVYIVPGEFTLSLGANDNNCSSHTKTITVSGTQTGITYELVFTDQNNQSSTVSTLVGNGNAMSFTHTPVSAGSYSVLAVNAPSNCTTSSTNSLTIYLTPGLSSMDPAYCSTASPFTLVGSPAGGSYEYELNGGGFLPFPDPTIDPGTTTRVSDTYRVKYISAEGCESKIESTTIYKTPSSFSISTPEVCSGRSATFSTNTSETGMNYYLYLNGSSTGVVMAGSTGSALDFSISSAALDGIYSVRAQNSLHAGCYNNAPQQIVVKPTPAITNLSSPYCTTQEAIALEVSAGHSPGSFERSTSINGPWTGFDGTYDPQSSELTTTDYIRYTYDGCVSDVSTSIVYGLPDANDIALNQNSRSCSEYPLTIDVLNPQTGVTYQLFDPNSSLADSETSTGAVSLQDNPAITGQYSVTAYNHIPTCAVPMNNTVEVFTTPSITTPIQGHYCSNQGTLSLATSAAGGNFWLDEDVNDNTAGFVNVGGSYTIDPSVVTAVSQTFGLRYEINGCYHNYTYTLNKLPGATSLISPDPACSGRMLEFTLNGAEAGMNYQLKLNNEAYSLQRATTDGTHIFHLALGETGQVYTATGQSPNINQPNMSGCFQDATGSATIIESPHILVDDESVCENTTVNLSSDPDDGGTFAYSTDNGTSWTTLSSPSLNTGTCGTADCSYQLRYTGSNGCTNAEEKTVTVYPSPEERNISSINSCAGNDVVITVENAQAGVSYQLYKNGHIVSSVRPVYGTATGEDLSFAPDNGASVSENDVYSVRAYSGFGRCWVNMQSTITVGAPPADVTGPISGPTTACLGETATYSVSEAGTYHWSVPAGYTIQNGQNTQSITVLLGNTAQAGNIRVSRSSGSCTGTTISLFVNVNSKPVITDIEGNFAPCRLTEETYTAIGEAENYQWHYQYGANWNLIGTGRSVTTDVGGTVITYPLRVTATNEGCPAVEFAKDVSVRGPLTQAEEFSAISAICDGASVQLEVLNTSPYIYTWEVTGDLTASATSGRTITITGNLNGGTAQGSGTVTLSASNGCGAPIAGIPRTIQVNPVPEIASLTVDKRIECQGPPTDYGSVTATITNYVAGEYSLNWPSGESGLTATQLTGNGSLLVTRNGCSASQSFTIDNRPLFNLFPGKVPCGDNNLTADEHNNLYLRTYAPIAGFDYSYSIENEQGQTVLQNTNAAGTGFDVNNITGLAGAGNYTIHLNKQLSPTENCPNPYTTSFRLDEPGYSVTSAYGNGVSLCNAQQRLQISCDLPSYYNGGHNYQVSGTFKDLPFTITVVEENGNYYIPIGNTITQYGAGSYQLDIVDVTWGCTFDYDFSINPMTAYVTTTEQSCNELGTATVHVTGGSGPFAYYWYTGDGVLQSGRTSYTEQLEEGTYYVVVEMLNGGCRFQTEEFAITTTPVVTNVTPNFGNTCTPQVTFEGGTPPFVVSWVRKETVTADYPGAEQERVINVTEYSSTTSLRTATAYNIPNGDYVVKVHDKFGCEDSSSIANFNADRYAYNFDICISFDHEYKEPDPIEVANPQGNQALDLTGSLDAALNAAIGAIESKNEALYNENCLNYEKIDDELSLSYPDEYKQYTLYYYDRAGNLIQTMPPKGVKNFESTDRSTLPNHDFGLGTRYTYNSLGQVVEQTSPDGGTSVFVYDKLGRLRFSRNSKQLAEGRWSYSIFDYLGRPVEAGELIDNSDYTTMEAEALKEPDPVSGQTLMPSSYNNTDNITEWVKTTYTTAGNVDYNGQSQRFLNNRVSYTETWERVQEMVQGELVYVQKAGPKTYYSYDPHGNVEWMVQEIPGIGNHTMAYEYDLITGNVNKVIVNEGRKDAFYHRYQYDDDNRLVKAFTSRDGELWDEDANYQYYDHGPLMRAELGQDKVQGLDYVYTIQGWLKTINNPGGTDPGDVNPLVENNDDFADDVFSMALSYYQEDYQNSTFDLSGNFGYKEKDAQGKESNQLYNGNISAWTSKLFDANETSNPHKAIGMSYRYDQLNRIKSSKMFENEAGGFVNPHGGNDLTSYTYDPNGNITRLERRSSHASSDVLIDVLEYQYIDTIINGNEVESNQLRQVEDVSGYNADGEDIKGTHIYHYDKVGNLILENQTSTIDGESLNTTIKWTVQNKVKEVIPSQALNPLNQKPYVRYTYDASGNRVHKYVNSLPSYENGELDADGVINPEKVNETYYLRDAQGNVMNVYQRKNVYNETENNYTAKFTVAEQHLYGSDRIGLAKPGEVVYTSQAFNPESYQTIQFDLENPEFENVVPTYNWSTVAQTTVEGADDGGTPFEVTLSDVDMYTLDGNIHGFANKLSSYNTGEVKQTAVAENQDGDLIFYALATRQGTSDVCLVFNKDNQLLAGSENISLDADKEITTYQHDGRNYLLTQQGTKMYRHQLELNTQSGNFEVVSTNEAINEDDPALSGQIAVVEDRTVASSYLFTAGIGAGNTLELLRYDLSTQPATVEALETISGAYNATDIQISQKAKQLLVEYTTSDVQNALTLAYPAALMVYQVDENYQLQNGTAPAISTTETPENGSAVFSADGERIYWCHEGTDMSLVREYNLENDQEAIKSNVTGAMLSAYNQNIYLAGDQAPYLHYWNELISPVMSPVTSSLLDVMPQLSVKTGQSLKEDFIIATRHLGQKYYELKDHLGNVRATISDLRTMQNNMAQASVKSYNNYYPFGMLMPGRWGNSENYRYGFNGKEMDNDMRGGTGATYDYGFRIYDSRIAKFLSVDPLTHEYPWYTPYQYAGNKPIWAIDLDGLEEYYMTTYLWKVDGSRVKLNEGILYNNGNWDGVRYGESYFFEGKSNGEGGLAFYNQYPSEPTGEGLMKMYKDNPYYGQALRIYHNFEQKKFNRQFGNTCIVVGGVLTTIVTFGSASPFIAFGGMATGVTATTTGTAKIILDSRHEFEKSDLIPTSPLGIVGLAVDKSIERATDYESSVAQNIGELVNAFLFLKGDKWMNLTTRTQKSERLVSAVNFITSLYNMKGVNFTKKEEEFIKAETKKIFDWVDKIQEANDDDN